MKHPSSFRDPNGFIFFHDNELFRCIKNRYKESYDLLMNSGLYEELVRDGLLISHKEIETSKFDFEDTYKIIQPSFLNFISYPYEWSFTQLKQAALATLEIQKRALNRGMILKDCSAYNIQFVLGKPMFVDTLSFDVYKESQPWHGYLQCCQHFLAPLALMAKTDVRLLQLLRINIDGIPLDLASKLLPKVTYLSFSLLSHIHIHAMTQRQYSDKHDPSVKNVKINKESLLALTENLYNTVNNFKWKQADTEWGKYYKMTNYTDDAFEKKKEIINGFLETIKPKTVWDIGANNGLFSRIASDKGIDTVAFDIDPVAVENNTRQVIQKKEKNMMPLVMDLTNPSMALGWDHSERQSMKDRGPVDMVFGLAIVHHLAISNNLPLPMIFSFFADIGNTLVIEFVPKSDSQVKKLFSTREDIFPDYTESGFEKAYEDYFSLFDKKPVHGSERVLYLLKKKQ